MTLRDAAWLNLGLSVGALAYPVGHAIAWLLSRRANRPI